MNKSIEEAARIVLGLPNASFSTLRNEVLSIADSGEKSAEFLNLIGKVAEGTSKSALRRYKVIAEVDLRSWFKMPLPEDINVKSMTLESAAIETPAPSANPTPAREGSKQAIIIDAMENGVTVDELVVLTAWTKSAVQGAIGYDIRKVRGYPVFRKEDKWFLGAAKVPHTGRKAK